MHPALEKLQKHLDFICLSSFNQQELGRDYYSLAERIVSLAPDDPETTVAVRKLLESRDAAFRAIKY